LLCGHPPSSLETKRNNEDFCDFVNFFLTTRGDNGHPTTVLVYAEIPLSHIVLPQYDLFTRSPQLVQIIASRA